MGNCCSTDYIEYEERPIPPQRVLPRTKFTKLQGCKIIRPKMQSYWKGELLDIVLNYTKHMEAAEVAIKIIDTRMSKSKYQTLIANEKFYCYLKVLF